MEAGEILIQAGLNLLLGFTGTALFIGWGVREYLRNFSWSIFWGHNKPFVIWVAFMLVLLSIILAVSPEAGTAIKTLIGLDVSNEPAANIALGWALALAANAASKKKINKKHEQ
ncbi:MAG: hypothetical protein WBG90_18460 [Saonia sp.]